MAKRLLASLIVAVLLLFTVINAWPIKADSVDVIINEIMQNPSAVSDANGEWFELLNPTGSDIDINGWTIKDNDIDSHMIDNGGPLVIPAGGYLILGCNANSSTNGGVSVDYVYGSQSSWAIANGADEIILLDSRLSEIDRVEYDGGPNFPDPTGASMALRDPVLDNNIGANWCTASTPYGDGDLGTPGAENDCAPLPVVIINEIMQNPQAVSDDNGEWFELFNPTGSDIDINGWTIKDNDIDSHMIDNGGPLVIPAGGYLVLGCNANSSTNGGVSVDYIYGSQSSWAIANGADEIILLDGSLNEIDRVEYDGGINFPDPTGASMALRDPVLDNNIGANWCTSSTPYGDGDFGTPGADNDCVLPPSIIEVSVDIKPGSDSNPVNVNSKGVLPVAILGTADFDATQVDPATMLLSWDGISGVPGIPPLRWNWEDINRDGFMDLGLKYSMEAAGTVTLTREASGPLDMILIGKLLDGTPIAGEDTVRIINKGFDSP